MAVAGGVAPEGRHLEWCRLSTTVVSLGGSAQTSALVPTGSPEVWQATGQRLVGQPFAHGVPVVSAQVTDGTRRAYGSYWNRVVDKRDSRRLDEPTPSEVKQFAKDVKPVSWGAALHLPLEHQTVQICNTKAIRISRTNT